MDVAAEKVRRLLALDPGPQRRAAGVLAGCVFVEPRVQRRKMNHQVKPGDSVKGRERHGDLFLGIFAGRLERGYVAVA